MQKQENPLPWQMSSIDVQYVLTCGAFIHRWNHSNRLLGFARWPLLFQCVEFSREMRFLTTYCPKPEGPRHNGFELFGFILRRPCFILLHLALKARKRLPMLIKVTFCKHSVCFNTCAVQEQQTSTNAWLSRKGPPPSIDVGQIQSQMGLIMS